MEIELRLAAGEGLGLPQLPSGVVLPSRRQAALDTFASAILPSTEEELWRYTDVSFLSETKRVLPEGILSTFEHAEVEIDPNLAQPGDYGLKSVAGRTGSDEGVLRDLSPLSGVLGIRDGIPASLLLSESLREAGVVVKVASPLEPAAADSWFELVSPDQDIFTSLVAAVGIDVYIEIPDGLSVDEPLVVSVSVSPGEHARVVPLHLAVKLGKESQLPLFIHYLGSGNSGADCSLLLPVTEARVGEGSRLSCVILQELEGSVCHIETSRVSLERDAWLSSTVVALGGRLSRHRVETEMAGDNCESEMLGIYFGNANQHLDFRTLQDHQAPRTVSDLLYKGAVEDAAKAVYAGLVRVEKNAQKINGFQTNKNLVLSEGASAESIPNLEILANDVRCSHASSIGPVDEEELYYLESRGIEPDVAEELIVEGFFEEVIERIPSGMTAQRIRKEVSEKFQAREAG